MPRFGVHPPPVDPFDLDRRTLEELERVLDQRLTAVSAYNAGGCPTCRDAEAHAFLAKLRALIKQTGGA